VSAPKRIQLSRKKGWRKPEGAVFVARPSKWGNPFVVHEHTAACGEELDRPACAWSRPSTGGVRSTAWAAVKAFEHLYRFPCSGDPWVPDEDEVRAQLHGLDLACWCPLDQPCHADVLLELANS
jgi:hypothetical protein